jgi:hypothetical protein
MSGVINAAPAAAAGADSAISTPTVKLGSTIGNPLVTTLFFALARKDYFRQMSATGMSVEQIQEVTAVWRKAVNHSIAAHSSAISEDLVQQLRASFHHALAFGLHKTMLSIGLVCLICAVSVWFGLKGQKPYASSRPA